MKKILTLFAALVLLAVGATAQKLSYSAVVRNSANELQANKTLTVGVSIANSATGDPVYSETHSGVQTNQNGLLTLTIGEGSNVDGNLSNVTWSSAYITTTYTIDGSTVTNTVAVNAVPYALYAENSGTSTPVNDGVLTITMPDGTTKTFTANQLGNTNVTIPAAPVVNNGTLTIKQGDNTLGTFTANQDGPTEVNIPAAPVVNNGTLTIQKNGTQVGTFSADQGENVTVNITITPQDIIDAVGQMTDEQKSALCSALNCGGGETPTPVGGQPCPGTPTVQDNDPTPNTYKTVQIGTQCWTAENLRSTRYADGTTEITDRYAPNGNAENVVTYGYLYNWAAVMHGANSSNANPSGVQGICPTGWHVPSDAEWTQMQEYLSNYKENGEYRYRCGGDSVNIAKALASTTGWNMTGATENYPCQVRYEPATTNNASGFGALPAGERSSNGSYYYFGNGANFWSTTGLTSGDALCRYLNFNEATVNRQISVKNSAYSVRCVKDATSGGGGETPTTECPTFTDDPTALTLTANGVEIMAYTSEYVEENTAVTDYGFRVYTVADGNETLLFTVTHSNYPDDVYPEIDNDNDKAYIGAFVSMSDLPTIAGISLDVLAAVGTIYKVYPFITCANETNNGNPVEYTVSGGETPTTECPTFLSGETELEASDSKYIALISYSGGSGNETVSGSYTVANDEISLVLDQTLFINRTSKQVSVEIAQSAVSLNVGDDLLVEVTLTDGTCTQSTATGVYTEPAEGQDCPEWGDVTGTSFLVLNNNTVQLKLFGHNFTGVTQEAFEVMLNETTEQTFTSMVNGDDGDYEYIILTGSKITGVNYADATYRIIYTPSQNCEQSSGLEVEGSFAICPYFVETTSITATSAYEFVVSTVYEKSGNIIIENGGYKVYTTPNLDTPVATVQMTPATQIVVTADNDELIAIVDLTDLITPEALALLDGQTLYIQPFLTSMECGTVTGEALQYIVQEPTTDCPTSLGAADATLTNGVLFATTTIEGTYDNSVDFHYDIVWTDDNNHTHSVTANYVEVENNVMSLGPNGFALNTIDDNLSGKTITIVPSCTCYVTGSATAVFGTGAQVTVPTSTSTFTCGTSTVTDNDPTPHTYNTVQIGNQCWMAENLRSEYYADGTTEITGLYAPNDNAGNVATYGYLYNWAAVMHGTSSSEANPSGVQGICPTGWHVPSDAEWTQLQEYVSNYKENNEFKYRCNDDSTYIAKALASTTGWKTNGATVNSPCEPRYNPATKNNASGFGAMPAGFYRGYYYYFGYNAYFWSSTHLNSGSAWYRDLKSGYAYVNRSYDDKSSAYSVRCLKN